MWAWHCCLLPIQAHAHLNHTWIYSHSIDWSPRHTHECRRKERVQLLIFVGCWKVHDDWRKIHATSACGIHLVSFMHSYGDHGIVSDVPWWVSNHIGIIRKRGNNMYNQAHALVWTAQSAMIVSELKCGNIISGPYGEVHQIGTHITGQWQRWMDKCGEDDMINAQFS